jgi:tRNA threonylcarbamoyladenosine biosynthesis protein TsaB
MKILALEFSSDRRSVAVAVDGAVRGQASEAGGRESHPFRLIEQALREAGLPREAIEVIAVGLGPGSYNGVRSAIAVAQGWQFARLVQLIGLSSVACLATRAQAQGIRGVVSCVVDAQRGEFYLASYAIDAPALDEPCLRSGASAERRHLPQAQSAALGRDAATPAFTAPGYPRSLGIETPREISALHLATPDEVLARAAAGDILVSPDDLQGVSGFQRMYPDAATLALWAMTETEFTPGEQLEPIYLRVPAFVKAPPPRVIPGL